jgi:hypothetical protein
VVAVLVHVVVPEIDSKVSGQVMYKSRLKYMINMLRQ